MISFKRLALTASLIAFLFYLSGCLVMMPLMMGGMFKKDVGNSMQPEAESTMSGLMREGVAALAANAGTYQQILLGNMETNEDFVSPGKFKQSMLDVIRLKNGWKILDQETILVRDSEDLRTHFEKADQALAVLDAQLYKGGGKLWLAMQLVDARSAELFWSGIYSGPLSAQGWS